MYSYKCMLVLISLLLIISHSVTAVFIEPQLKMSFSSGESEAMS